jgi:hypothetical protein
LDAFTSSSTVDFCDATIAHAWPCARCYANAPYADGSPSIATVGIEELFTPAKIAALYSSDEEYVRRFEGRVEELVAERWLLREDVEYVLNDPVAS